MKFTFGDIVVVDNENIGVIVKCWGRAINRPAEETEPKYEVYVRMYNGIIEYKESEVERYLVRHKYLSEEELEWQSNAVEGL
jgi:hypothetical protein